MHKDDIIAHLTKGIHKRDNTIEWLKTAEPATKHGCHRLYEDVRGQSIENAGATKIMKKDLLSLMVFPLIFLYLPRLVHLMVRLLIKFLTLTPIP